MPHRVPLIQAFLREFRRELTPSGVFGFLSSVLGLEVVSANLPLHSFPGQRRVGERWNELTVHERGIVLAELHGDVIDHLREREGKFWEIARQQGE